MSVFLKILLLALVLFASMELIERVRAPLVSAPGAGPTPEAPEEGSSPTRIPAPSAALSPSPTPIRATTPAPSRTPQPTLSAGQGAKTPKQVKPIAPPVTEVVLPVPVPAGTPIPTPVPVSDAELYARVSGAVVQIFCTTPDKLYSASGVIVSQSGLVLTNAHVADIVRTVGEASCTARRGNPAEEFSGVRLVYTPDTGPTIPDTTVSQRDFAFLKLDTPRGAFGSVSVSVLLVEEGSSLYTLGYPSEFLQSIAAFNNSNLVFSILRVDSYADLDGDLATIEGYVSKGGLALQQGSSGTALFNKEGSVLGIIFATTKAATTADREGIALSMPYIDRVMRTETGRGLQEFILGH